MPGPYAFKQIFAADPSNTSNVAKGGSVLLFAPGDASRKPLVLTDLANGMVLPNPVPINSNGFGPAFLHETLPQVAWEGGGFSGTFESFEGLRADAVAAVAASQASAQAAGDARVAAQAAAGNAATGAAGALAGAVAEATAAKVAAQQAANLVGAPAGDAVLAAIQPGGAAYGALSGTIGAQTADKLVSDDAVSLIGQAFANLTASKPAAVPGLVALGDSITIGMNSTTGAADSWPTYAGAISKQKLRLIRNSGVGGNTTAQMLARFTADVSAHAPKMVSLLAGSNDLMQSVPVTTTRANYRQIIANIRAIGAEPIILTVPPRAGGEALVTDHNRWLAGLAAIEGIRLVDMYTVLANGTAWKPGFNSGDGIHPSRAGYAAMGAEFDRIITPDLSVPFVPDMTTAQTDAANLYINGLFAPGAANVGTGWTAYGPGANLTFALEPADVGNWQVFNVTIGGAGVGLTQTISNTKWVPGDRLRCMIRATTPQGGDLSVSLAFGGGAGGNYQAARNITQKVTDGVFMIEFTVPAGATSLTAYLLAAAPGTYKAAQATLRKII